MSAGWLCLGGLLAVLLAGLLLSGLALTSLAAEHRRLQTVHDEVLRALAAAEEAKIL